VPQDNRVSQPIGCGARSGLCGAQVRRPGAADASVNISAADAAQIARMRRPVWLTVTVGAFVGLVVWPLLSLPANVFPVGYFRFWVVLMFIILILASLTGIFLPVWEARGTMLKLFQWRVRPRVQGRVTNGWS
jgi:uncharacterized protein YacL